jgi:hypothetical protein
VMILADFNVSQIHHTLFSFRVNLHIAMASPLPPSDPPWLQD